VRPKSYQPLLDIHPDKHHIGHPFATTQAFLRMDNTVLCSLQFLVGLALRTTAIYHHRRLHSLIGSMLLPNLVVRLMQRLRLFIYPIPHKGVSRHRQAF
jgi:hypothetical protein